MHGNSQLPILNDIIDEGGQIAQDLERQVSQGPDSFLDGLPGITGRKRYSEVLASCPQLVVLVWQSGLGCLLRRLLSKSIEMADKVLEVFVVSVGLKSQLVLERHSECDEEVHCRPGWPAELANNSRAR